MRCRSSRYCLALAVLVATWSPAVRAEHSVASFPDEPAVEQPKQSREPPPPTRSAATESNVKPSPRATLTSSRPPVSGAPNGDRDAARDAERRRKAWLLSLEGVTHAPVDVGMQLGIETPQGLRLFGGMGWVPSGYMNLLSGIAANASRNGYAQALLEHADYSGRTWRLQAGFRPFRAVGLYADVGYARVNASGALDLASSGVPQLTVFGGGYQAQTRLDMWLVELGYQGELADRLVLGAALGLMGTFNATTQVSAVGGAPTNNAVLAAAASQADGALEKYGFVPTLSLRLGFDLI